AHRLLADIASPAAMFTADGELIEARPATHTLLGERRDLLALGAEPLAREASVNGVAEGEIPAGQISMLKLGADRLSHCSSFSPNLRRRRASIQRRLPWL
ncbi:MAG: hypothetical protein WCF76_06460, partial [Pseudolabrys sp.]